MGKTIYQALPWTIKDEWFLMNSIKTEFDALSRTEFAYWIFHSLKKSGWWTECDQHIWSDDPTGWAFLMNFYSKLYQDDISFRKDEGWKPANLKRKYTIWLRHHHCLQVKKPWELWLNTFGSSAWLMENFLNEMAHVLPEGQRLEVSLKLIPDKLDSFSKEVIYAWKGLWKSEEYVQSLESSFNDRLWFFLFELNIEHEMDDAWIFDAILNKNLSMRESDWNAFSWKKSKKSKPYFPKRKRKGQADMFLGQGHVSLIQKNSPLASEKSVRHIAISQSDYRNWGFWDPAKITNPVIGFWFRNCKIDEKGLVSVKLENLKNGHWIILWWTWSGKSYTSSLSLGHDIIRTSQNDLIKYSKNGKPWSRFIIADPHWSMWENIELVLWSSQEKTNNVSFKEYCRQPLQHKGEELCINPLYLWKLDKVENFNATVDRAVIACLDWIRWTHSEASFWAQNTLVLSAAINLFILFNIERLSHRESSAIKYLKTYTLADLSRFLKDLSMNGKVPNWTNEDFRWGLWSQNKIMSSEIEKLKSTISRIGGICQKNATFLSSSINKIEVFEKGLSRTFWEWLPWKACSFDLGRLFSGNDGIGTEVYYFNMGDWTAAEKSIISSFILSYSFHYWTCIAWNAPNGVPRTSVRIDEAASVLESEHMLRLIGGAMAQMRKYGFDFKFLLQSVGQKAFEAIYPHIGVLQVFSVNAKQFDIVWPDMNAWSIRWKVTVQDIVNCPRWWFYCLCKFSNTGNSLALVEWLSKSAK